MVHEIASDNGLSIRMPDMLAHWHDDHRTDWFAGTDEFNPMGNERLALRGDAGQVFLIRTALVP